jgi:hypothetical protein
MWTDDGLLTSFIVGVGIGIIAILVFLILIGKTYKDGQVDALTGNIRYELITLPDSTKEWRGK